MNNDFLRHGKEYPGDVLSMVTWLLKRRGGNNTNYREDAATGGVTSFENQKQDEMCCPWEAGPPSLGLLFHNSG